MSCGHSKHPTAGGGGLGGAENSRKPSSQALELGARDRGVPGPHSPRGLQRRVPAASASCWGSGVPVSCSHLLSCVFLGLPLQSLWLDVGCTQIIGDEPLILKSSGHLHLQNFSLQIRPHLQVRGEGVGMDWGSTIEPTAAPTCSVLPQGVVTLVEKKRPDWPGPGDLWVRFCLPRAPQEISFNTHTSLVEAETNEVFS